MIEQAWLISEKIQRDWFREIGGLIRDNAQFAGYYHKINPGKVIRTSAQTVHWRVILDMKYWFEFKWVNLICRLGENSRQTQNISLLVIIQKYLTTQCHNWPIKMEVLYGRERNIIPAVTHFNSFRGLQWLLWRNADLSVSQQLLNEVGDVSTRYRDVLYTAANHITFCLKDKRKQKSAIFVVESSSSICLQMPLDLTKRNFWLIYYFLMAL